MAVHRALRRDQHENGILLPGAISEKGLKAVSDRCGRGLLRRSALPSDRSGRHRHAHWRGAAEKFWRRRRRTEARDPGQLLILRNADHQRIGFRVGRDGGIFQRRLRGKRFFQFEDAPAHPHRVFPVRRDLAICRQRVSVEMLAIENRRPPRQATECRPGSARRASSTKQVQLALLGKGPRAGSRRPPASRGLASCSLHNAADWQRRRAPPGAGNTH